MVHTTSRTKSNDVLYFEVLKNAMDGDTSAINALLKHYAPYLKKMATRELFDTDGTMHTVYDDEIRRELEIKFITGLLEFKPK